MISKAFISHNSKDAEAVELLADKLRKHGIDPWLAKYKLAPGADWLSALQDEVANHNVVCICIGQSGLGPVHQHEAGWAFQDYVKRAQKKLIPVLLPGAGPDVFIPPYLEAFHRSDMREGISDQLVAFLAWGITGKKSAELRSIDAVFNPATNERRLPQILVSSIPEVSAKEAHLLNVLRLIGLKAELNILHQLSAAELRAKLTFRLERRTLGEILSALCSSFGKTYEIVDPHTLRIFDTAASVSRVDSEV